MNIRQVIIVDEGGGEEPDHRLCVIIASSGFA